MSATHRAKFARLILPLFFIWSVMLPYREVHAFVAPPGVIPPPAFVATSGPSPVAVGIGALAVGAVVGYLLVGALFGDDTTDAVRIQVASPSTASPPVPAAGTPPNVTVKPVGWQTYPLGQYKMPAESVEEYCGMLATAKGQTGCGVYYDGGTGGRDMCMYWNSLYAYCANGDVVQDYGTQYVCPSGYTVSGTSCILNDPRAGVSDKKQDVLMSGEGAARQFSIPADADTPAAVDGSKIAPILRGDGATTKTAYIYGKDSSGRQVIVEVAVSPDGTQTYVRHYTQDDSTGQSQIQKTSVQVDTASGTVTAIQRDVQAGTITSPASSTLPQTSTAAATPTDTPQVSTSSTAVVGNSANSQQIVFPTDYARTGESQNASNSLRDALLVSSPAPADPALPDPSTYTDFGTSFDALKGWQLPGHTSQCPTGSFTALGSTYIIDSHCTLIANHWGALQVAMSAVWTITALFLVLRA